MRLEHLKVRDHSEFFTIVNTPQRSAPSLDPVLREAIALAHTTGLFVAFRLVDLDVIVDYRSSHRDLMQKARNLPGGSSKLGYPLEWALNGNRQLRTRLAALAPEFDAKDAAARLVALRKRPVVHAEPIEQAELWARLMQARLQEGEPLIEAIYIALFMADSRTMKPRDNRPGLLHLQRHWRYGRQLMQALDTRLH